METLLVKVSGRKKADMLLQLLKSMDFIESVDLMANLETTGKNGSNNTKTKLSDKYKGVLTKEKGQQLNDHIKQMRDEWNTI